MAQPFVPGPVPVWIGFRHVKDQDFNKDKTPPSRYGSMTAPGPRDVAPPAAPPAGGADVFGPTLIEDVGAGFGPGGGGGRIDLNNLQPVIPALDIPVVPVERPKPRLPVTGGNDPSPGPKPDFLTQERTLRTYSDGPIGPRSVEVPVFLGYTMHGADLEIHPEYAPVTTDAGGGPTDVIYRGSQGVISLDFTRWREDCYGMLADHAANTVSQRGDGLRGRHPFGRVGTIMGLEKASVTVYLPFPYSGIKQQYASQPMGYRFVHCVLSREGLPSRGSKPARLVLNFWCYRTPDPRLLAGGAWPATDEPAYLLYDNDMSALAGLYPD